MQLRLNGGDGPYEIARKIRRSTILDWAKVFHDQDITGRESCRTHMRYAVNVWNYDNYADEA